MIRNFLIAMLYTLFLLSMSGCSPAPPKAQAIDMALLQQASEEEKAIPEGAPMENYRVVTRAPDRSQAHRLNSIHLSLKSEDGSVSIHNIETQFEIFNSGDEDFQYSDRYVYFEIQKDGLWYTTDYSFTFGNYFARCGGKWLFTCPAGEKRLLVMPHYLWDSFELGHYRIVVEEIVYPPKLVEEMKSDPDWYKTDYLPRAERYWASLEFDLTDAPVPENTEPVRVPAPERRKQDFLTDVRLVNRNGDGTLSREDPFDSIYIENFTDKEFSYGYCDVFVEQFIDGQWYQTGISDGREMGWIIRARQETTLGIPAGGWNWLDPGHYRVVLELFTYPDEVIEYMKEQMSTGKPFASFENYRKGTLYWAAVEVNLVP